MKIRIKQNHWYPKLIGVTGCTIYPYILLDCTVEEAIKSNVLAHEWIHVKQVRGLGWFHFYARYFLEYLRNRLKGMGHEKAYYEISFERIAYELESTARVPSLHTEYIIK